MNAISLLADRDRRRVVASAAMMTSNNDGEALAAVRATCRLLAPHGLRPADVFEAALSRQASPPPQMPSRAPHVRPFEVKPMRQHQQLVMFCQAYPERLTEWEVGFLRSISAERTLSTRQHDRLQQIARAVEMKGCRS